MSHQKLSTDQLKGLNLELNEAMASAFDYFNDSTLKTNCKKSTFYFPDFFDAEPNNDDENDEENYEDDADDVDNDHFKPNNNTKFKPQEFKKNALKRQTTGIDNNLFQFGNEAKNTTHPSNNNNNNNNNSTSFELDQLTIDNSRFKINLKHSSNNSDCKSSLCSSSSSNSSTPSTSSTSSRNGSIETPVANSSTLVKTPTTPTTNATTGTHITTSHSATLFKFTQSPAQLQLNCSNNKTSFNQQAIQLNNNNNNNNNYSSSLLHHNNQHYQQQQQQHHNHHSNYHQQQQQATLFNIENELIKYTKTLKICRSYSDEYKLGAHIRDGGFSEIYEGWEVGGSQSSVIIKLIPKIKTKNWLMVHNKKYPAEVLLHKMCNNIGGVVRMLEFYEQDNEWVIVMPKLLNCVDLFDYLESKQRGRLGEQEACHFFTQLIKINMDLLNHGVVHRDLKSENLLVDLDSMQLVLIDFGASAICRQNSKAPSYYTDFHGTKQYKPPEYITSKKYTAQASTIWTLGILLYDMCNGQLPFENEKEILAYNLQIRANVSDEYKKILFDCLQVNPEQRPTLQQLLEYPWIVNNASKTEKANSMNSLNHHVKNHHLNQNHHQTDSF